jgi:hypothetical protein
MFEGKSWNSISISLEGDFCLSIDQPRRLSTGDPQSIIGFDTKNGLMTWMICGYPYHLGNHINHHFWLVVSTPLKNMSSSVGVTNYSQIDGQIQKCSKPPTSRKPPFTYPWHGRTVADRVDQTAFKKTVDKRVPKKEQKWNPAFWSLIHVDGNVLLNRFCWFLTLV